jgi:prevent-host-death family protein
LKVERVTTLKRQATRLIAQIRQHRAPILITEHGLPAAYLVDVESFERQRARLSLLEGIARGERAVQEGRVLTHRQAKRRMKRWLA